ncbi:MAG: T9SS type A sorting domain-containing protein [Chitinophagales bacterium]
MKKIILSLLTFSCSVLLFSQTLVKDTFMFDGLQRDYILYIPQIYDGSTAVPLVLNIHGRGSNADEQNLYGNLHPQADADNFLIVHPNSTVINGTKLWNSSVIPPGGAGYVDDVGFLNALLDTMIARYNIDTSKIYSTGMSNGGFMSYTLACELGDRIKKIASVTGSMTSYLYGSCNPGRIIPVLEIHGTTDPIVPYNGGSGMQAIEDVIDFWVQNNNCNTTPLVYNYPDINTNDSSTVERYTYHNATDSNSVIFFKVIGGGHTWPNAIIDIPAGNTNRDFDASETIWQFFKGGKLVSGINNISLSDDIKIKNLGNELVVESDKNEIDKLEIYNGIGQKMIGSNTKQISLEGINNGVYFLIIYTPQGVYSKTIVR